MEKYGVKGYLGIIENPIGHFHVYYPEKKEDGTCHGWMKTDDNARLHNCTFATNGGPFSFKEPSCLGNIISDGKIVQSVNTSYDNFGLTKDGYFIMGILSDEQVKSLQFDQLMTGFGFLLEEGKIIPKKGGEVAPRTMIGTDKEGKLMILEVDGIELYKPPKGLTLQQAAEWFLEIGGWNAVNLDGGGSSATYYNGKIVDYPTCHDLPFPSCVRAVTTITCIKQTQCST